MKKNVLFISLLFISNTIFAQSHCATMEYLNQETLANPGYKSLIDSVNKIYFAEAKKIKGTSLPASKSITTKVRFIPLVIHILYDTTINDIPDQRVYSQIKVLNDDFLAMNANLYKTQPDFVNRIGVSAIQFYIADKAPDGSDTIAIIHKKTSVKLFPFNNNVKHNRTQGDSAWNTNKYLNIWVCAQSNSNILGYSSFPGTSLMYGGNDGTVVNKLNFGLSGHPNAPYHLGRTLTHELGHYLGLYHTFEFGCTAEGDSIKDTPPVLTSHSGCEKGSNTCSTDSPNEIDMVENFMDYSDDACMTMFSVGQVGIMNSVLKNVRDSLGFDSTITFTTQIGIESNSLEINKITVFPNPTNDVLNLETKLKILNFEVYNSLGQQFFIHNNQSIISSLNVEQLPKGIYFLKLFVENDTIKYVYFQKQ